MQRETGEENGEKKEHVNSSEKVTGQAKVCESRMDLLTEKKVREGVKGHENSEARVERQS